MKIVVWNTQGNKWDILWRDFLYPNMSSSSRTSLNWNDDVLGLVVEAGWAPWVNPAATVFFNGTYPLTSSATWYQPPPVTLTAKNSFSLGILARRANGDQAHAVWVPWVKTFNSMNQSPRCSIGGTFLQKNQTNVLSMMSLGTFRDEDHLERPALKYQFGRAGTINFTLLLVHLKAKQAPALKEQAFLTGVARQFFPSSTPGMIVGDLNINLLQTTIGLPAGWRILQTGQPTQDSGGELDWALLYDPNNQFPNAKVSMLAHSRASQPPPQMKSPSDHAVLLYDLPNL